MPQNYIEVLTGAGAAAVAVVRITGPGCDGFLKSHFSHQPRPGKCVHGELRDQEDLIDDVVVTVDESKTSAEICTHGSTWIVDRVKRLAADWGFQILEGNLAEARAVEGESDRLALEREVSEWLPQARTELAVRMLGAQIDAWEPIFQGKVDSKSLVELSNDLTLHRLLQPPTLAIVGRPNAGKSTLANRLFQCDRSIIADVPGTTRDWVGEFADLDGLPVLLLDTPGIRDTDDAIESEAIRLARTKIETADLVLWLRDGREMRETSPPTRRPVLNVANKCDLPSFTAAEADEISLSAKSGEGIDHLKQAIVRRFGCGDLSVHLPRCWTPRQRRWLAARALKAIGG